MRVASFIAVFLFVFFLAGWFLEPHLPPQPNHPISALELEYWQYNWIGVVLGMIAALISARSGKRRGSAGNNQGLVVEPLNPPRA